jgi:hypothetical protein
MKRITLFLTVAMVALTADFWGCGRVPLPTPPSAPMATPTLTPTLVPGCGVSIVGILGGFTFPTATPGGVLIPTPTPAAPAITPYPTPIAGPAQGVIRNLTEWQAAYGTATPPVNFSQQMLVQVSVLAFGCSGGEYISNVCWDNTQVTVSLVTVPPAAGPICNVAAEFTTELVAVPQSNLPVVAQLVGHTGVPLIPLFLSPTPTATP